jgi:hypothetical protein
MRRELGIETGVQLFACYNCGAKVPRLSSLGCCPRYESYASKYGRSRPLRQRVSA